MIRPYRQGDECYISTLEAECFSEPWSAETVAESAAEGILFFVYETHGSIVGYIGLQTVLDEGYITNIAVDSRFRRNGIGKALLKEVDKLSDELCLAFVSLEVRESNVAAINLYTDFGYKKEGVRKNFYRSPLEDAIIMTKRRKTT